MRQREFLSLVGYGVAAWPFVERLNIHAILRGVRGMPTTLLALVGGLVCLFAWTEPSVAQYSERCIYMCRQVRPGDVLGENDCFHHNPACTGTKKDGTPIKFPQPTAKQRAIRAACDADFHRFCQGVRPARGGLRTCLVPRKNQLSPACKKMLAL